jgi:hypothetical protein
MVCINNLFLILKIKTKDRLILFYLFFILVDNYLFFWRSNLVDNLIKQLFIAIT